MHTVSHNAGLVGTTMPHLFWGCSDALEPRALVRLLFTAAWRARGSPAEGLKPRVFAPPQRPSCKQLPSLPAAALVELSANGFHQHQESHASWAELPEADGSLLQLC